jgi:hypothetical protein
LRDRDCGVALDHSERRNGAIHHTSGGNDCALTNHNARQDQRSSAEKRIATYRYTFNLAKMCQHSDPQTQDAALFQLDGERTRCIEYHVITDPNILADLDSTRAMERNAQAAGAGNGSGQLLKKSIPKAA